MKASVPMFLEILVGMIGDDYKKVAEGSRQQQTIVTISIPLVKTKTYVRLLKRTAPLRRFF